MAGWKDVRVSAPPDYDAILVYLAHGEKGNGEIAVARYCSHSDGTGSWWTWGGPNSGCDLDEAPILWKSLDDHYPSADEIRPALETMIAEIDANPGRYQFVQDWVNSFRRTLAHYRAEAGK